MVKYCAVCGETFSQKFVYCPACASVLTGPEEEKAVENEFYQLTFVEPKNLKTRNLLLLGSFILMTGLAASGTVYSLFNSDAYISALDDNLSDFVNVVDSPALTEIETPELKEKGKGGGGGGGGRKDNEPISNGELPPQFKDKPLLTPSKEDISVTDPALVAIRGTKGPQDIIPNKRSATNGDPNSTNYNPSNGLSADDSGMGQNGMNGIGNNGRDGVGEKGTGGIGTADGDKYGDKNGPGGNPINNRKNPDDDPPSLKPPVGPSVALNIVAKPRATYTDAARQYAVQGTVTLRVTFLANGAVGSIVAISGLPHGLTEQAIAAARSIKFEPAKRGGQPYTVTKNVQYNFVLY